MRPKMTRLSIADRFWSKVNRTDECWVWTGAVYVNGYGAFVTWENSKRRNWKAHRMAWILTNGPIPNGLRVCHHCDNPPCVRPTHLFLGTDADNLRDARNKGRRLPLRHRPGKARGERQHSAKLTAADVADIRRENHNGIRQVDLAVRFGVSQGTISAAVRRQTWAHVE